MFLLFRFQEQLEEKLQLLSTCNDQAVTLLKANKLNEVLLTKPLSEMKEDICNVLESMDEPLCSTRVLNETEELIETFQSNHQSDDETEDQTSFSLIDEELLLKRQSQTELESEVPMCIEHENEVVNASLSPIPIIQVEDFDEKDVNDQDDDVTENVFVRKQVC